MTDPETLRLEASKSVYRMTVMAQLLSEGDVTLGETLVANYREATVVNRCTRELSDRALFW